MVGDAIDMANIHTPHRRTAAQREHEGGGGNIVQK